LTAAAASGKVSVTNPMPALPPDSGVAAPPPALPQRRTGLMARLRNYLLTGLLALVPSALTVWVLIRLFNWVDNLLGRYLRFAALDYRRIPGIGLVATVLILIIVGWITSWLGTRSLFGVWDHFLTRIPGVGILYGSTKSLGEAFLSRRRDTFKQVVLVPWPHPALWRVGFIAGPPSPAIRSVLGEEVEVVFLPSTPNPVSGFVHYVPKSALRYLDWSVEQGLKVIISGGVHQPGAEPLRAARAGAAAASSEL
jgi:uncharacterized membrane protein